MVLLVGFVNVNRIYAQEISLQQALKQGMENYETIRSKTLQVEAQKKQVNHAKTMLLPDIKFSAQQVYGTANAWHGPQYSFGEGMTTTSMPQDKQNWEAAFGSLYMAGFNWTLYSFGQTKNNIRFAESEYELRQSELEQEKFKHQIQVSATYFNLLAMQQLVKIQERNIDRAKTLFSVTQALTSNNIRPKAEAAMAEAEVATSRIALLKAQDKVYELSKDFALITGIEDEEFLLDSSYMCIFPIDRTSAEEVSDNHPSLRHAQDAVEASTYKMKIFQSEALPRISLVGTISGRGSGFGYNYTQVPEAVSHSYTQGVGINRSNFLIGIGLNWNFTSLFRNRSKVASQKQLSYSLEIERNLLSRELKEQTHYADKKLQLAYSQYNEAVTRKKAAQISYNQYLAMYRNGLTSISDLAQAMYALTAAESEQEIMAINIWQAYLLKIANNGDIEAFIAQINNI